MKKKLLIFDLDGTIADTIWSIRDGVNLAMDKYGLPRKEYEDVRAAIGNGARLLIKRCIPEELRDDETFCSRVFEDYDRFYEQTYANVDGCYEGMSEALHTLHEKGYAIAVLSNKQDAYVKKIVGLLFPDGIVAHAQGQTDLPIKPDPTVPLMIARALGFSPEETIFIGDSDVDIITGKNAGMRTVGCAWGYRGRENLVAAGADHVIDHASELLDLFS
jgi:phosphoglycolate phosphatase